MSTMRPTEFRAAEGDEEPPRTTGTRTQLVAGEIIGERYRLIRKLGEGGMGVVWVAHSLPLGVDVAVKLMRTGLVDKDLTTRMAREAQLTATLAHPALVRVFDFGTTSAGDPYLVMELVQGETLAALLRREKKLPPAQALQLLLPVLDGLRCAHERGIVHRDIKPENILVARDALGRVQPKLLDFGIAKLESAPAVGRLTQVGEVLGSPEFMSPEQARGSQDIDARTDIWSACIVLYEMLTGSLPFKLQNYNALMQSILHEEPVSTFELGVGDRNLWLAVQKGLEKSKQKRWSNMSELGEVLALWLYDQGIAEDAAGNSLKAQWLGGSLPGRPPVSSADAIGPTELPVSRAVPTLRVRLRRFRHRAAALFTPAVRRASAVGLVLLLLGVLLFALRSTPRPRDVADSAAAAAPSPVTRAGSPITAAPAATLDSASRASAAPYASMDAPSPSASANKHLKKTSPARSPRGTTTAAPSKGIHDFGF